ncbi:MAG: hypothetical protein JNM81_00140 [Rhodospirillaceae bacterium]|nr:hypothetical protein [Rhodospirillaceae bacterium]
MNVIFLKWRELQFDDCKYKLIIGDLWGKRVNRREGVDYTLKILLTGTARHTDEVVGYISIRLSHSIFSNLWLILFDEKLDAQIIQSAEGIELLVPAAIRQWAHLGMLSYEGYYDAKLWNPAGCYLYWNPEPNEKGSHWGGWMTYEEDGTIQCGLLSETGRFMADDFIGYKSVRISAAD